jgi:hypothetical protein
MGASADTKETLPLTAEQKQVVGKLSMMAKLAAGLLLVLGLVQIVGAPIAWWSWGWGLFAGLLTLVQGALCALLGLVMLAVSTDFKYLGEYPRFSGNHLRNAAKSLAMFCQVLAGLAVVLALVVVVRLLS